ncbi:MAG TPA: hypothetical protein VKB30_02065 [Candidatus Limnocylindrales bacterium]|nr:hypothetical protein [Candidatus Limnocylindrales bacterium]
MTDSHDRISGPRPEDEPDDPDSQTFFEDQASFRASAGTPDLEGDGRRDALSDGSTPNAGYTGGLAEGDQSAVGMRQIQVDETTQRRREGRDDEPPANLAQQDQ